MIQISNLTKKYGETVVFSNLNYTFENNCIYGLVGRNGSCYKERIRHDLEIMHSIDNALHKLYNDNINRLESRWIYGKCIN